MEFVVSAIAQVAKLSVKCPQRGTNGASACRWVGEKRLCWPNLDVGERPCFCCKAKGVQLMPLRDSSADILVVYLLFCLHLCITKGTIVKLDSVYQGFAHQWWHYKCSVDCCHYHPWSNVCLQRPTRQPNMPLVNAKNQGPICLLLADRKEGLGHVIW